MELANIFNDLLHFTRTNTACAARKELKDCQKLHLIWYSVSPFFTKKKKKRKKMVCA